MSQELQNAFDNPDYLVVSGSRLYGTDRPGSDWDYRGFTIPPFDYLIGLQNFEMGSGKGEDHKVFSLKRFFDLVSMGDPQSTEILFVPYKKIVKITKVGQKVRDNRSLFISNLIYKRIMGYGYSEWRKAMGERLIIEKRSKTLD
ncbi:MAG: DNA polymerase beta superfamily protein, partial [Atribacterota bacterium]